MSLRDGVAAVAYGVKPSSTGGPHAPLSKTLPSKAAYVLTVAGLSAGLVGVSIAIQLARAPRQLLRRHTSNTAPLTGL